MRSERRGGARSALIASLALAAALAAGAPGRSEDAKGQGGDAGGVARVDTAAHAKAIEGAIGRGLDALAKQQPGHDYPLAVASMTGLAVLAARDSALFDPVVLKAYRTLRGSQVDGLWPKEGFTWVHTQGFATLFFAELYGKVLFAKEVPKEIAKDELRKTVSQAVTLLAEAQSKSGGWWYTKSENQDEGSTTVCAVQALRAAKNFGIPVEPKVLERGFAYLKAMQNKDGGFRYMGTAGGSMGAGTAAAVATLVLMAKLDEKVLIDALGFLDRTRVDGIAHGGHGQYGAFYAAMAMKVIDEEYGDHMPIAGRWRAGLEDILLNEQSSGGSWQSRDVNDEAYGTALSVLTLACPAGRLSVFHRRAPKLPE